jgi:glycosyltransferase involved in cell wall biosynthesis
VIITDSSERSSRNWFPQGVNLIVLDDYISPQHFGERSDFLYKILRATSPKRVHIINSIAGWILMKQYGQVMEKSMEIYGNFYAFQYDDDGSIVGFIKEYFEDCFPFLKKVFSDNRRVKIDLIKTFDLDEQEANKLEVAYNPVRFEECERSSQGSSERFSVLWAGRLDAEKLPHHIAALASRIPEMDFYVYGSPAVDKGGIPPYLEGHENIKLCGKFDRFTEIFDSRPYDCFLFTSKWEGMPNVILEAIYCGIPVVAPDIGGVAEVVVDDKTGILVSGPYDLDGYETALRFLKDNPTQSKKYAENARTVVREIFNWNRFKTTVASAYLEDLKRE